MSVDPPRAPAEAPSALPAGTRLHEFEILRLLGVGGFGIVYLAFDHALEREVAIKEYMPASLVGRTETLAVSLRSDGDAEVFALGLRSFVNEARLLARFDHPSLLKVHRFFEANGTAYMAMPVMHGRTLKQLRLAPQPGEPPLDEARLRALLEPLLGALGKLHEAGVYHRDIAPDNIVVEPDGRPVLLDFGAARRVIGDRTQTLTAILKPAYAPVEQYAEAGSVKQGPWTDFYALGATLHHLLLGRPPEPATARALSDDAPPLASRAIAGCSEEFLRVVDWMLAPRPGDRPQSVAELREALHGQRVVPAAARGSAPTSATAWERTQAGATMATPPPEPVTPTVAVAGPSIARVELPLEAPATAQPPNGTPASQPLMATPAAPARSSRRAGLVIGLGGAAVVAIGIAAAALWPRGAGESVAVPVPASAPAPPAAAAPSPAASPVLPAIAVEVPAPAASAPVAVAAPVAASAPPPRRATAAVPARPSVATTTPVPMPQTAPSTTEAVRGDGSSAAAPTPSATTAPAPPVAPPQALPAPAPAPVVGPEARCATRDNPIRRFACMERLCLRSEFRSHPDCVQWRREARPRE